MRYPILLLLYLLPVTLYLLPDSAFAGDALSLKGIIEEAKNNNPEIEALRRNVKAKEARARVEGVLDDPTLKVEMEDLSKDHPLNISPGNAPMTRYTLSQMFPYPGKLSLQRRIAEIEILMAEAELKNRELDIVNRVKEAYYEYLFVTESIKIVQEIKELLSTMAEVAEIKYATAQVSQQDVISAQVELTMLMNEVISLEAERGVIQAEIKALLNRPQDSPLPEPEGAPEGRVDIKTERLIQKSLEINPELRMMRYEIEASRMGVDLAKKDYYPDFMVGVAPIQREGRFDAWDAMFQINIPVWRSKYSNQAGEAARRVEALQSRLKAGENMKTAEVKGGAIQAETADKIRTLYKTTLLPQTELSFESALKNYQTANVDFLTLLDRERVLKKTRIEYIDSLIKYYKRIASLERLVGEELPEE